MADTPEENRQETGAVLRSTPSLPGRVVRLYNKFEEWAVVWILLGLAFVSFLQVINRKLLSWPAYQNFMSKKLLPLLGFNQEWVNNLLSFTWVTEISQLCLVIVVFLGSSLGVKYAMHFSMDLVIGRLPDRTALVVQTVVNAVSAVFFTIIVFAALEYAVQIKSFGNVTAIFKIKKYWGYLIIAVLCGAIAVRYLWAAGQNVVQLLRLMKPAAGER